MGSCLANNTKKSNFCLTPISKFSNNPQILKKITAQTETKKNQTIVCPQLEEIRAYDVTNPHRQFNVKLNGVNFEVVNSIEDELLFEKSEHILTNKVVNN